MVLSKNHEKKIHKKVKRCQAIITAETGIECLDTCTENIIICNAGLSNGLQQEAILSEVLKICPVLDILMPIGKSYCFLKLVNEDDAKKVYTEMNGISKLGQNDTPIYLSFCKTIPKIYNPWCSVLPPGLILIKDFVDDLLEEELIKMIHWNECDENSLKHRKVKHFGYEFIYGKNNVDKTKPLDQKIPKLCDTLWDKLKILQPDLDWYVADQMTVNKYEPGQGIPPHVDTHSAFVDPIISLSLESDIVMEFKNEKGKHVFVDLPRKSLLIMSQESRYGWIHGITPRKMDIVPTQHGQRLTIRKRSTRLSFTFRKLKDGPCICNYPTFCDSSSSNDKKLDTRPDAPQLELENVHNVYNEIAKHFSDTRHSPWPKVEHFVNSLKPGSILIDIGCGNGKYLNVNPEILKIGCDRSLGLLNVCQERNLNIFQCDCLAIPFKDNSVDACICIAVIHHLASEKRRLQAIQEMARILVKGGQGLIYVWAKNQEANDEKSSYLKQNKQNFKNPEPKEEKEEENLPNGPSNELPIHTNRTQFKAQDVLVPWKLKPSDNPQAEKVTFLRFYHVFVEQELVELCEKVDNLFVVDSYYDQGNWCVIFEKK